MNKFNVLIYFTGTTQPLLLTVEADCEDEAIELAEDQLEDFLDDYEGQPYKFKVEEIDE